MTIKRARVLPSYKGNDFEVNKNYKVLSAIDNGYTITVFLEDENGRIVNGWTPSQEDLLSDDWVEFIF